MNDSHLSGQRAPRAEEPKRKNGEDKAGSSDDGGWDRDSEPGAAGRAPGKRDWKTSKRKAATGPWARSGRGPRGTCYLLARGPRGTCYLLALPSGLSACTALPSASLGRRKQASEWGPDSSAAGEESARAPASAQPLSHPFAPPPPGHGVSEGGGSWLRSCWWRGVTRLCSAGGGQGRWGWGARSCPPRGEPGTPTLERGLSCGLWKPLEGRVTPDTRRAPLDMLWGGPGGSG